jgi:hypothetical protein
MNAVARIFSNLFLLFCCCGELRQKHTAARGTYKTLITYHQSAAEFYLFWPLHGIDNGINGAFNGEMQVSEISLRDP